METTTPSPSGKYIFQIDPWEARMSLWVEPPRLIEVANGQVVFDLIGTNWSLDSAEWEGDEDVKLSLRRYPGDHSPSSFEVLVDCSAKQAGVNGEVGVALGSLDATLEALYLRSQTSLDSANRPGCMVRLERLAALFRKPN